MEQRKSVISLVIQVLCIVGIIGVSYIYVYSSLSPWSSKKYNLLEPRVSLETRFYVLPQKIYRTSNVDDFLIEKARNFHSGAGTSFISNAFFRPDFENYPIQTGLILLFRLATYAGIVLSLILLLRIAQSISAGALFEDNTELRLFNLGLILLFLPIIRTAHSLVLAGFIRLNPSLLGYELGPHLNYLWLSLFGLVMLAISFFFREARYIYEEQKLTV